VMLGRIVHSWYVAAVVLQAAALVVPRADRAEWLAEWQGELWHVGRACGADRRSVVHGQQRITAFCAGAFQDAFALQLDACSRRIGGWVKPGTASRCMLLLGSLFVVSFVCSLCLPQVRSAMWKAPARASDSLVLVTKDGYLGDAVPTIRFEEYRAWKANRFPFTTKLVFYRPVTRWVRFNQAPAARLTVAYASETMLGILAPALRAPWPMGHKGESQPRVLLSRGLWRRYFNNGSAVANQTIDIAGQKGGIIGVAPEESWPVPGSVDLVVLESDAALASLSPDTPGFMLPPASHRLSIVTIPDIPTCWQVELREGWSATNARPFPSGERAHGRCLSSPLCSPASRSPRQRRSPWETTRSAAAPRAPLPH